MLRVCGLYKNADSRLPFMSGFLEATAVVTNLHGAKFKKQQNRFARRLEPHFSVHTKKLDLFRCTHEVIHPVEE
jgi:hypothetical protein